MGNTVGIWEKLQLIGRDVRYFEANSLGGGETAAVFALLALDLLATDFAVLLAPGTLRLAAFFFPADALERMDGLVILLGNALEGPSLDGLALLAVDFRVLEGRLGT